MVGLPTGAIVSMGSAVMDNVLDFLINMIMVQVGILLGSVFAAILGLGLVLFIVWKAFGLLLGARVAGPALRGAANSAAAAAASTGVREYAYSRRRRGNYR